MIPDPVRVRCGKAGGRPRRYDLSGFAVGQSMQLPWRVDFRGRRLPDQGALHAGIRREELRLGFKFARAPRPTGMIVTRVS